MKAVFLTGLRQLELRDVPEPVLQKELNPRDVLLQVDVVGVCGSDMHYYRAGRIGDQIIEFPWIVGHECSATVLDIGDAVEHLRVGDRVAVDPLVWCGNCDQCLAGRENTCRNQKFMGCPGQLPGCLAERIIMPAASCFAVPDEIDAVVAALIEPLTIGMHAHRLAKSLSQETFPAGGPDVCILGCGPIGLCTLLALRAAGPATVYVTDIRDNRSELAEQLGADWGGNPHKIDIVAAINNRQGQGADIVFECAGEQETFDQAIELVKPGGKVLVVGIPEFDRYSISADSLRRKEITIQSVRRQNQCIPGAIELAASGNIELESMVTHHFGFEETQEAFEIVADYADGVVKAVIHVS